MVSGNFLSGPIIMIITSAGALALVMSGFFRQPVRENEILRLHSIKCKINVAFYVAQDFKLMFLVCKAFDPSSSDRLDFQFT